MHRPIIVNFSCNSVIRECQNRRSGRKVVHFFKLQHHAAIDYKVSFSRGAKQGYVSQDYIHITVVTIVRMIPAVHFPLLNYVVCTAKCIDLHPK